MRLFSDSSTYLLFLKAKWVSSAASEANAQHPPVEPCSFTGVSDARFLISNRAGRPPESIRTRSSVEMDASLCDGLSCESEVIEKRRDATAKVPLSNPISAGFDIRVVFLEIHLIMGNIIATVSLTFSFGSRWLIALQVEICLRRTCA